MATNSVQIPGARGLSQGSTEANRLSRIDNVKAQIGKLSEQEARGLLTDISTMTANKRGYLRLDGSGGKGGGQLQFSPRWNLNMFRSAKTEVTRAALEALFDQAKLDKSSLDALFPQNAGNGQGSAITAPISNRRVSEVINRAIGDAQTAEQAQGHQALQRALRQYRTVQFDGRPVGGAARPHGCYIKGATQGETFDQLRKAGYNTILSIDDGRETTEMKKSVPKEFRHETDPKFVIKDFTHPSIRTLVLIKDFVDRAHREDGKVLIHCGAGAGRTGTVLASLVLADLVKQERAGKLDYSVKDAAQNIVNVGVEWSHEDGDAEVSQRPKTIPVPKIVADAINTVRLADEATTDKDQSVETDYQVGGLMSYLGYLLGAVDIDGKPIN